MARERRGGEKREKRRKERKGEREKGKDREKHYVVRSRESIRRQ
jgi:hypothetical protein